MSLFITLEGPEGSGKTTQAKLLAAYLETRGYSVLCTREPGGTSVSEQIRQVILSNDNNSIRDETEALLYSAARAQIVASVPSGKVLYAELLAARQANPSTK